MISRVNKLLDPNVHFSKTATKITKYTKKWERIAHSKKKINQQKLSLKKMLANLLDKDSKTQSLKEVQRTKGKCVGSKKQKQENKKAKINQCMNNININKKKI